MQLFANYCSKKRLKHHFGLSQIIIGGFITLFLLMTLGACATTYDKMDKLNMTLRNYEKALRWAKFDVAYSYHQWDENEQPGIPKHLKDIKVTSYKASNNRFDEKNMTAKQMVTIRYYNQNNLRERTLETNQSWKYFPDKKRWYLTSKPPTFE